MKIKLLLTAMTAAGVALFAWAASTGSAQEPVPMPISAQPWTVVANGLLSPRGMKLGADGMLYVAEAGSGGDEVVTVGGGESHSGFTGRISKIDPTSGVRTTVADKLPSNAGEEGDAVGPADVAFLGGQLYYVQTHGGDAYGFPANPTGVYKVNNNGTVTLVADIGKFNIDNPIADISSGAQQDIEVGGNPYSMTVRDGTFLVVDGNQNQIMQITSGGSITRIAEFSGHPVTTGLATQGSGPLYVGGLGQFPFAAADGNVFKVGYPTGNISEYADGVSSITDVEFGPGGKLYAVNFGDQATSPDAPAPWGLYTAKLLLVNSDGTMSPLVDGLIFATSLIFNGDSAYISNGGVSIPGLVDGQIVRIDGVSSLQPLAPPPAPQPTTAPAATPTTPSGITPPNTGTGGDAGAGQGMAWLVVLSLALACVGTAGVAFAFAKR